MTYNSYIMTVVVALCSSVSFAATPVATVSSTQPFTLAGNSVWAAGVNSWPVVLGDDIETATAPAAISFQDGSRVTLAANSHAKVAGTEAEPKVVLLAGWVDYNLAVGSKITISRESVRKSLSDSSVPVAVRNRSNKVLYGILGAGGGAAAILGAMMAAHGGSSSSGSGSGTGTSQISPQ